MLSVGTLYHTIPADPHPGRPEFFGPTGWGRGSTEVSLAGVHLLLLSPNHAKHMVKRVIGKYKAAALLWLDALVWQGWGVPWQLHRVVQVWGSKAGEAGVGSSALPVAGA